MPAKSTPSVADLKPEQCRAARGLLGWVQMDLQKASGITQKTITDFESGTTAPQQKTLGKIRSALEKAGVVFIDSNGEGPGVRLSKPKTKR